MQRARYGDIEKPDVATQISERGVDHKQPTNVFCKPFDASIFQGWPFYALLAWVTPTATPTTMAMIRTKVAVSQVDAFTLRPKMTRTDDEQRIPLPLPGVARALDGMINLGVRILDIVDNIFGALVDLLNSSILLMHQLRNFLVQTAQFNHVLFDLSNSGGSLQSSLSGVIGLSGSAAGNLSQVNQHLSRYWG